MPIMAFNCIAQTPPIKTYYRSATSQPLTISDLATECAVNVKALTEKMAEIHPFIHQKLTNERHRVQVTASGGRVPDFVLGDYVLVARADFSAGEKLALRWRGPRCLVKEVSDYIYTVEDLRNGVKTDVHVTGPKLFRDRDLYTNAVM